MARLTEAHAWLHWELGSPLLNWLGRWGFSVWGAGEGNTNPSETLGQLPGFWAGSKRLG